VFGLKGLSAKHPVCPFVYAGVDRNKPRMHDEEIDVFTFGNLESLSAVVCHREHEHRDEGVAELWICYSLTEEETYQAE
jgi:hypothetical protein